jgi:hypothetical protein
MGNTNSSNSSNSNKSAEKDFDNFYDIIDYIATYYILTMDFKSLSKLCEKEYCDKLVVITSDIIKRYFNDMEVTYLEQRVKNGVEINNLSKENVIYVNKDQLETLDISNDAQKNLKKKRVCIGIAKFYIKIAHIFSAIVMTINPVYTYKDSSGQTVKTGLMEKDKIPKNSNRKLYKLNICDNRIRALKKGEVIDDVNSAVTMQPKICDMNVNKDGTAKSLNDEPGIPELMALYLDDNYDYSNGTFTGMSDNTKKQFQKDLKNFYTVFTGNDVMPPEITKFSDIKLKDFNSLKGCQGNMPTLKNKYTISKNDKLFTDYAKNTQNMIQTAATNQSKLLEVINELFTYVIDPYNGKQKIRVNPKLTDESLQKSVEKTRKLIIELYVECEMGYVRGIKLYEAIVEAKILETTQNQINALNKEASKIIDETTKVVDKPKIASTPPADLITRIGPIKNEIPIADPIARIGPIKNEIPIDKTSDLINIPTASTSFDTPPPAIPLQSTNTQNAPINNVPPLQSTNTQNAPINNVPSLQSTNTQNAPINNVPPMPYGGR